MSDVTVQFFASLREDLGKDRMSIVLDGSLSVSDLVTKICAAENTAWQNALGSPDILVAVNQTLVERTHLVQPGDEVAFLPPVTGG
ncbi:MAG: molybdopterin synthase sulfur carrier subunit [Candidatus Azotimanducaceae bacterium]|jgi:molybdopterin synthase sulfur carrier subunit